MTNWHGWVGNILRIDLSKGEIAKEPLTEDMAYNFVGGRGINSKILYDETGPETDPLGTDNVFIIGTGPSSGTLGLGNGRFTLTAKSPLTGILGDGSGGGHFGAEIKFAGYDHIVIKGKAKKPVYIWIDDDEVIIKDASHVWGKTTWETHDLIREELGDQHLQVLAIGPAGENLVKYALAIMQDERCAAETGTGAVMGSKNLKAIAVRGSKSVKVAKPDEYMEIVEKWYNEIEKQSLSKTHREFGSAYLVSVFNRVTCLCIKNTQQLSVPKEEISQFLPEYYMPKVLVRSISCFSCPHGCQKFTVVPDGPYAGEKGMRPEYGCISALCTQLGVFDYGFALKVTNLANQLGVDADEIGPTMAMAFECYQRGIVTRKDTDGLRLEWGNKKAILELMRKIAYREGFGNVLAEGCRNAALKIGKGADKYAYHIKGKAHCGATASYIPSVLGYALASRGWDHLRCTVFPHVSPIKGPPKFWDYDPTYSKMVMEREHIDAAADMIQICKWLTEFELMAEGSGGVPRMSQLLTAITGVDFSEQRLHEACDRLYNIERAYLVRMGLTRDDDVAPHHFYERPIPEGPWKGRTLDREQFEKVKDAFYELRGGDIKTGAPKRETLRNLGLEYVAKDLEKTGIYNKK